MEKRSQLYIHWKSRNHY